MTAKAFICAAIVLLGGCTSTRQPVAVPVATLPALHGNLANGGLLSVDAKGGVIDNEARQAYNALVDIYGNQFFPPLAHEAGVTVEDSRANLYRIDLQHLADFAEMVQWRNAGRLPKP
jgi:hypothetical protein